MSSPAGNATRVLRALKHVGADGLTASDFLGPTLDGGPPILRLAAVVHRLRERGHRIDSTGRRGGGQAVYVLLVRTREE